MKKTICILFLILMLAPVASFGAANPPELAAEAAVLMDAGTGQVLYEKNMDAQYAPSSLAKIMTAIIAIESKPLSDTVTVSKTAINSDVAPRKASHISLVEGEELTLKDLLYAMIVQTANDAANVIAEYIAGSLDGFTQMMNTKAQELGCINTNFTNPTGLDDENNYTSAYDVALITKYAIRDASFSEIFAAKEYTIQKTNKTAARELSTGCAMLKEGDSYYERLTGGLSGWTSNAKYNCASHAEKSDKSYICIILKGTSTTSRYTDSIALYNYTFDNFKKVTLKNTDIPRTTIDVVTNGTKTGEVKLSYAKDISLWLYNDLSLLDISVRTDAPEIYTTEPNTPPNMLITVKSDKMYNTVIKTPYIMETSQGVYTSEEPVQKKENGFVSFLKGLGIIFLVILILFIAFIICMRIINARRRRKKLEAKRRRERRERLHRMEDTFGRK